MIKDKTEKILKKAEKKQICIIGDVMLDKYLLGEVSRISPEAPVQVVDIRKTVPKLGGAANVSLNIKTLGAEPFLIGVIGDDIEGETIKNVMKEQNQDTNGLIVDYKRSTTSKTRVIAASHHLLRIDSESKDDISKDTEDKILGILKSNSNKFNIILLQDYNKGVLTKSLIHKIIKFAKEKNIKVLVDPKFENFFEFKNVFVFKPNRKELEDAFGRTAKTDDDLISICNELIKKINCDNLVLTLGEKGIMIIKNQSGSLKVSSFKTRARKVADVSGAGDTVISTLAVCIAGGASVDDAVEISNLAAAVVVEEVGIVPIEKKSLLIQINTLNL
jgi:rfaE bifunctional protein kinase chain/domain